MSIEPDDPRHGTYAGWSQHDREGTMCPACNHARREYQRVRPHLLALGKPLRVPIGGVGYRNLLALRDANFTQAQLSAATGIAASSITRYIAAGPDYVTNRGIRRKLEALEPHRAIAQRLTHVGTVRRVQALYRIGYSSGRIGARAGLCDDAVALLASGHAVTSSATTRGKVDAAYQALHMRPLDPTHDKVTARMINRAIREGWPAPMAWDAIDTDVRPPLAPSRAQRRAHGNPVDEAVIERILAGDNLPATKAERDEVMRRWIARGGSRRAICSRLGWKDDRYGKAA